MRSRTLFAIALPAALLLGCSDSTRPDTVITETRTYVLESVDGHTLPYNVSTDTAITFVAESGSLVLTPPNVAIVTSVSLVGPTDSATADTLISPLQYEIHGDSIEVGGFGSCDPCFPNQHGKISDSTVTITASSFANAQGLLYRRVMSQ